jgi:hypothetical protein
MNVAYIFILKSKQASHNHIHKSQKNWYFLYQDDMGPKKMYHYTPQLLNVLKY